MLFIHCWCASVICHPAFRGVPDIDMRPPRYWAPLSDRLSLYLGRCRGDRRCCPDAAFSVDAGAAAIGIDIVHAIPLTFIASVRHLGMGFIDFKVLALLLLGSVRGIALGSRTTGTLPDWRLRLVLAIVLPIADFLLLSRQ